MENHRVRGFAEFTGTFALVFAGTGAIIVNDLSEGAITHPGISLTFGLVIMVMIYALGDLSGAHFNPAVTIGFWSMGGLKARFVPTYLLAQGAGGLAASMLLKALLPHHSTMGATLPSITSASAFAFETILTFLLMVVIIAVSSNREKGLVAGAAVGGIVGLEAMFAGPLTGASMNPARSLAPALASGMLDHLWIYLTAPVAGALLAVAASRYMLKKS